MFLGPTESNPVMNYVVIAMNNMIFIHKIQIRKLSFPHQVLLYRVIVNRCLLLLNKMMKTLFAQYR